MAFSNLPRATEGACVSQVLLCALPYLLGPGPSGPKFPSVLCSVRKKSPQEPQDLLALHSCSGGPMGKVHPVSGHAVVRDEL